MDRLILCNWLRRETRRAARVKVFATPQEAEAFALAKFKKMPSRSLIYPKDWPLCTSI